METYKPAGERLADLLAENKEANKKADDAVKYFKEQQEPKRERVFYFKGTVGEWREYSEHHQQDFEDFDLMNKVWK